MIDLSVAAALRKAAIKYDAYDIEYVVQLAGHVVQNLTAKDADTCVRRMKECGKYQGFFKAPIVPGVLLKEKL